MLGILDAADDTGPEARPVGLGALRPDGQRPLEEAPDILSFPLAAGAATQVLGHGLPGSVIQGTVQVCADTAACQKAGQHDHWTREAPTRILMAAHDTRTAGDLRCRRRRNPGRPPGRPSSRDRRCGDLSPPSTVWG